MKLKEVARRIAINLFVWPIAYIGVLSIIVIVCHLLGLHPEQWTNMAW